MTLEEALAAIRAEGLGDYRWFEDATNDTDIVAIQRKESGWVVFATDERATPQGRREFTEEGPALENFLSRLRSNNSVRAWHEEIRHEKPADPPVSGQFCRPAGYPRKRGTERAPSDRPA